MPFDAAPETGKAGLAPWQTLLLDAADIMERRGGCKGELVNKRGEVCFLGALSASAYGDPFALHHTGGRCDHNSPLMQAVSAMARHTHAPRPHDAEQYARQMSHTATWNNYYAHTTQFIVATMRTVAVHGRPHTSPWEEVAPL